MATIQENLQSWTEEIRTDFEQRREETTERTERFLREMPYAALGATVYNMQRAREAAKYVFDAPSRAVDNARKSPERVRAAFEDRAERGRRIVHRVSERDAVEKAADQAKTARSKAKGLGTSISRVFRTASAAIEDAAEATFEPHDTRAYEQRTVEELRELAAERSITGRSGMNKKQLIEALRTSHH